MQRMHTEQQEFAALTHKLLREEAQMAVYVADGGVGGEAVPPPPRSRVSRSSSRLSASSFCSPLSLSVCYGLTCVCVCVCVAQVDAGVGMQPLRMPRCPWFPGR